MKTNSETARVLVRAARAKGIWIATAESCTGGLAAGAITAVPGASESFLGGVVSYALRIKRKLLGVPGEVLDSKGAVSRECAEAMAQGALERLGADIAVSVTGIAGPGGAKPGKPVGLVWFGLATKGGTASYRKVFSGGRVKVRKQAVAFALEKLLEAVEAAKSRYAQ